MIETVHEGLDALGRREYWGRLVLAGQTEDGINFGITSATGRSDGSRARRYEPTTISLSDGSVVAVMRTNPLNLEDLETNPQAELIYYPAAANASGNIVVTNGAQTMPILEELIRASGRDNCTVLERMLSQQRVIKGIDVTAHEPDPLKTSRISALIGQGRAAFAVSQYSGEGTTKLVSKEFELQHGVAWFVATYDGMNKPDGQQLTPFGFDPRAVRVYGGVKEIVQAVYNQLGPKSGPEWLTQGKEFRVGVCGAYCLGNNPGEPKFFSKNTHGERDTA